MIKIVFLKVLYSLECTIFFYECLKTKNGIAFFKVDKYLKNVVLGKGKDEDICSTWNVLSYVSKFKIW